MMQRTWFISLAGFFALGGVSTASAEWMEEVIVDRLTGQKTIMMTSAALNSARQFGRIVSSKLVLQCIQKPGKAKLPRAAIIFSERVASETVRAKYRIDNDPIRRNKIMPVEDEGATIALGSAEFISRLRSSSVLLIEFSLYSAGATLLEFDTTGASEAFKVLQCVGPRTHN